VETWILTCDLQETVIIPEYRVFGHQKLQYLLKVLSSNRFSQIGRDPKQLCFEVRLRSHCTFRR
ncbi:MAG: hypothetical protein ACK47L_01095, partial [Pseudanabaena sp.]|jgi:hypothetical protein